jgi:predicted nucleic acid-binding protein
MIFIDTNVLMYAVGGPHPIRAQARAVFEQSLTGGLVLVTSAAVLQELLHAYLAVGRLTTLDAALDLAQSRISQVWPVEAEDARFARMLAGEHPALTARDLLHLACCRRREVREIRTFNRALAAAFGGG